MSRIGLIDVDNMDRLDECYPNLALMKLSAWHKEQGDTVEWYEFFNGERYDKVYASKVFSFSEDYPFHINSESVQKGGTGYSIHLVDSKEQFDKSIHNNLPYEVEHSYPDYDLYGITDTAYGFMSRGCPRGCGFCHVKDKEGLASYKVADLEEFWCGQKNIILCDPNTLACPDWRDILGQLAESKSWVDFNQGVDIRMMTEEKAEMLRRIKVKRVHFAYDRYQDKQKIEPKFQTFKEVTGWDHNKIAVYVLVGYDTTMEENLDRIYFLRSLDFNPYVMVYNKENLPRGHELKKLQRWVNNKRIFWKCPTWEEYMSVWRFK